MAAHYTTVRTVIKLHAYFQHYDVQAAPLLTSGLSLAMHCRISYSRCLVSCRPAGLFFSGTPLGESLRGRPNSCRSTMSDPSRFRSSLRLSFAAPCPALGDLPFFGDLLRPWEPALGGSL